MTDLVLALVLGLLAAALAGYLLWLLAAALVPGFGGTIERTRLRHRAARAALGDRCLAEGRLPDAVRALSSALYPYPTSDPSFADEVRRHHAGLMSRVLAVAEHIENGQVRLLSVAKLDRLFSEREGLQRSYLVAVRRGTARDRREARRALRRNAEEIGRAMYQLGEEISRHARRERMH